MPVAVKNKPLTDWPVDQSRACVLGPWAAFRDSGSFPTGTGSVLQSSASRQQMEMGRGKRTGFLAPGHRDDKHHSCLHPSGQNQSQDPSDEQRRLRNGIPYREHFSVTIPHGVQEGWLWMGSRLCPRASSMKLTPGRDPSSCAPDHTICQCLLSPARDQELLTLWGNLFNFLDWTNCKQGLMLNYDILSCNFHLLILVLPSRIIQNKSTSSSTWQTIGRLKIHHVSLKWLISWASPAYWFSFHLLYWSSVLVYTHRTVLGLPKMFSLEMKIAHQQSRRK